MNHSSLSASPSPNRQQRKSRLLQGLRASRRAPMAIFIALFAVSGIALLVATRAATAVNSVKDGRWSDPTVWSTGHVPEAGDTTTITHNVIYDMTTSPLLAETYVKGTLTFDPAKTVTFVTNKNMVVTGKLVMQPSSASVEHFLQFDKVDDRLFKGGGMEVIDTDVGLWVMDTEVTETVDGQPVKNVVASGKLEIAGTPKTSWTNATDSIPAGATSVTLKDAPTGWRVGDTIIVTPTEAPTVGNASYDAVEEREITAVSGNTVTFKGINGGSNGLGRAHPKVNNMWTAEVGNLTRNVRIEGSSTKLENLPKDWEDQNRHVGNSHIFIHSQSSQAISHAQLRYMGTTGTNEAAVQDPMQQAKFGRYSLHFHHSGNGSVGSVVDGVVVRDANFHQFVPHASNGIVMKNNIAYDNKSGAFWWDPHGLDIKSDSHDSVWDHNLVAKMRTRGDFIHSLGFFLPAGHNNKVLNNTYVGAMGAGEDFGGYVWVNSNIGVWIFDGNTAHNNNSSGIRVWQNSAHIHPITNFAFYHNQDYGMNHGAYTNDYNFVNGYVYGNRKGGLMLHANSSSAVQQRYENVVWDGAGITPNLIVAAEAQLFHGHTILFRDNTFQNYTEHGILMDRIGSDTALPKKIDLVNPTLRGPSPIFYTSAGNDNSENVVRVQPKPCEPKPCQDEAPYQIKAGNVRSTIAAFTPSQYYGTGTGLLAEHYLGGSFTTKVKTRLESSITGDYNENGEIPPPWVAPWSAGFTVRWTGEYLAQATGPHTFTRDRYMGLRLWIDDNPVINAWNDSEYEPSGVVPMTAGQRYKIRAEGNFTFRTGGGTYIYNLFVQAPGQEKRSVLPRSQLYCGTNPACAINYIVPTPPPAPTPTPSPTPQPDTTAPTVNLTAPANNATVSGAFDITANASDNVGVSQVEFLVDDVSRHTDPTAPFSFSLSTTQLNLSNGSHKLTARASDAAGNRTISAAVTINVNNVAPSPAPAPSPSPTPPPPAPTFQPADINQDGRVNIFDYGPLVAKFGQIGSSLGRADINQDGRVNIFDYGLLIGALGT